MLAVIVDTDHPARLGNLKASYVYYQTYPVTVVDNGRAALERSVVITEIDPPPTADEINAFKERIVGDAEIRWLPVLPVLYEALGDLPYPAGKRWEGARTKHGGIVLASVWLRVPNGAWAILVRYESDTRAWNRCVGVVQTPTASAITLDGVAGAYELGDETRDPTPDELAFVAAHEDLFERPARWIEDGTPRPGTVTINGHLLAPGQPFFTGYASDRELAAPFSPEALHELAAMGCTVVTEQQNIAVWVPQTLTPIPMLKAGVLFEGAPLNNGWTGDTHIGTDAGVLVMRNSAD